MDPKFRKAVRARLQQERDVLQARRRELEAEIAAVDARLVANEKETAPYAPVYILPDEILAMILKLAYQHHFPHCRLDNGTLEHSPASISRVSRRWRNVALSEPSLWNCIHIGPNGSKNVDAAEFVKLHLVWSGDLPVNFIFSCHGWNVTWPKFRTDAWPYYARCWRYILTQRHRWQNAAIFATHTKAMEAILKSMKHKAYPRLEYLSAALRPSAQNDEEEIRLRLFGGWEINTPVLRRLWAGNLNFWRESEAFKNLSEVKLHSISVEPTKLLEFLKENSSALKSLTLSQIAMKSSYSPASFPAINLPNLKFLVIAHFVEMETHREDLSVAASICKASPSLETFLLHDNELKPNGLLTLLRSSKIILHSVRHLYLLSGNEYWGDTEDELTITPAFVRAFPNLEILEVTSVGTDCLEVAQELDEEADMCVAWPALHTLRLVEIDEGILTCFVEHRAKTKHPIRTVALNARIFHIDLSPEILRVFERLGIECPPTSYPSTPYDFARCAAPYWDHARNAPIFVPWEDKWDVDDQWVDPASRIVNLDDEIEESGDGYEDEDEDEDEDGDEDEDEEDYAMDEDA